MKHLMTFNESFERFDSEDVRDIFTDFIDEGFVLDDVKTSVSLSIKPKLWTNDSDDFSWRNSFSSVIVTFECDFSVDISVLDTLKEDIKRFESYFKTELDWIYTVGPETFRGSWGQIPTSFNWFNSTETMKDILRTGVMLWTDKLSIERIELCFRIDPSE